MPKKRIYKNDENISFDSTKNFSQFVKQIVKLDSFITRNGGKLPQGLLEKLTVEQRQKIHQNASQLASRMRQLSNKFAAEESLQLLHAAEQQAHDFQTNLISTGKVLPSESICQALGITRQALSKAIAAKRLFRLRFRGRSYYPAFFADPTLDRRQLEHISKALGELDGAQKWQFFTTPNLTLGGMPPLEALTKGEIEPILNAADTFVELL